MHPIRKTPSACVALALALALVGCGSSTQPSTQSIARSGYIFGYPLVLMTETEKDQTASSGVNRFVNAQTFPPASYTGIVSPNADTLYSIAWVDLSSGPIVLHVPDTNGRYYLMPIFDAWTNVIASPGKRTTGTAAGDFALVGPNWHGSTPAGMTVLTSPTTTAWIVGRIQTDGPSDYAAVHAIQAQLSLTPLARTAGVAAQAAKRGSSVPPPQRVAAMSPSDYFNELAQAMKDNPPYPADSPIMAQLALIGVRPGEPFNFAALTEADQRDIQSGMDAARQEIASYPTQPPAQVVNGWAWNTQGGAFGTDYATRAYIAAYGLGANLPQDGFYPTRKTDASGAALNGATSNYVIHFAPGQAPPVSGFWSVTLYNQQSYFYDNPQQVQAVGSHTGLVNNADGSLDIYISHSSPGAGKESNWLPAPADGFMLMLRVYWPGQSLIDGTYRMPAPVRTGAASP